MNINSQKKRAPKKQIKSDKQVVMAEILRLRDAIVAGHLSERADISKIDEESRVLIWRVNDMLDAITKPLSIAARRVEDISNDIIPAVITDEFRGDFDSLKKNLNTVIMTLTCARDVAEKHIDKEMADVSGTRMFKTVRRSAAAAIKRIAATIFVIVLTCNPVYSQSLPHLSGMAFGDYYHNTSNHSLASEADNFPEVLRGEESRFS